MKAARGGPPRFGLRAVMLGSAVLVSLLPGCGGDPALPPPLVDDAELVLPGFDSLRVQLADGSGESVGPDGVLRVRAALTEWSVHGDFDADGWSDDLVVVWSTGGGSGTFFELVHFVFLHEAVGSESWVWRGSVALGDRVRVRAITETDGLVEVQLTEHGPDDPLCCPTVDAVRRFEISGGILTEVDPR